MFVPLTSLIDRAKRSKEGKVTIRIGDMNIEAVCTTRRWKTVITEKTGASGVVHKYTVVQFPFKRRELVELIDQMLDVGRKNRSVVVIMRLEDLLTILGILAFRGVPVSVDLE